MPGAGPILLLLHPLFIAHLYDVLRCSKSTTMSGFRNCASHYLAPSPSAGNGWSPAGAIQYVFFRKSTGSTLEMRPVAVRTEGNQVSSVALRTFHAMAKKWRHRSCASRYSV